jgi:hypothetical protein
VHLQRIKDTFAQEIGITLAGYPLDDLSKHDVARIGVLELAARGKRGAFWRLRI